MLRELHEVLDRLAIVAVGNDPLVRDFERRRLDIARCEQADPAFRFGAAIDGADFVPLGKIVGNGERCLGDSFPRSVPFCGPRGLRDAVFFAHWKTSIPVLA
ncbi:hypothetical protein [Novosphingobium profundi]|uniref:hypothetical protein n=1 Tax=Novosphingobium profundi TaxID=1774954 RepID=UPI0031BB30D4